VRVAFCGLGNMGGPMAARLLDVGLELTVWNRTRERAGSGAAAKVLNNFAVITLVSLLGEATALAHALGIEENDALEIVGATPLCRDGRPPVAASDGGGAGQLQVAARRQGPRPRHGRGSAREPTGWRWERRPSTG
jgi:hypothetical protein